MTEWHEPQIIDIGTPLLLLTDEWLIEAWHSDQWERELVEDLGVAAYALRREWKRLREAGRLPKAQRSVVDDHDKPDRLAPHLPHPLWGGDRALVDRLLREHPDVDPLLARLCEIHGPDPAHRVA